MNGSEWYLFNRIEGGGAAAPIPVLVKDLAERQARLSVLTPDRVPERFTLWLNEREPHGCKCRVAWRGAFEIGVQFEE
jgi:hypothetical protein